MEIGFLFAPKNKATGHLYKATRRTWLGDMPCPKKRGTSMAYGQRQWHVVSANLGETRDSESASRTETIPYAKHGMWSAPMACCQRKLGRDMRLCARPSMLVPVMDMDNQRVPGKIV